MIQTKGVNINVVQEIEKGFYRIPVTLPNSPLKELNSYAIIGEDRNILIDTGFRRPECYESLTAGIKEIGIDMGKTDILLTHLHGDHTGLAPDIVVPGTRVFISRTELPYMLKSIRSEGREKDRAVFLRMGFSEIEVGSLKNNDAWKMASDDEFTDYLPIDAGDVFTAGDYTLEAVSTPGHTPEHMCFWIKDRQILFTGDHVLFDISPNITGWRGVDDSLGDYLNSLREIDKYDVQLALPGHRETGDFHARIAVLINHHEKRLEECLDVLRANPGISTYDLTGKMTWKIRCNSWEDFPLGQKWFAVGECHAHIRHLEKLGKARGDYDQDVVKYYAV